MSRKRQRDKQIERKTEAAKELRMDRAKHKQQRGEGVKEKQNEEEKKKREKERTEREREIMRQNSRRAPCKQGMSNHCSPRNALGG